MNLGTAVAGVTPIRGSRGVLHGRLCARDRLICTLVALPLVMSVSSTAQATDLEHVDDALVLYVGQDVPSDGGNVIKTIDEVISEKVLGEILVHPKGSRKRPPVPFREAFPNVACYGAWLPSFEGLNRKRRLGHPAPSFFHKLRGYRSESKDLQLCTVDQGPETPKKTITNSARLTLEISDAEEPDWDAIDYHLARKLGEFVPREGESFSVSALICPRILQIRTPVRAAVRTRRHAEKMVERIREVAAKIQEPRKGIHPMIEAAVAGTPTVYFTDDADDFTDNQQYEYNLFDIYFERVSHMADRCVSLGGPGRPADLNAELNLDQSVRFVWDYARSEVPSPSEAPLIQQVLDELAGCEPQSQAATNLKGNENAAPPEPAEATEREGERGVGTDVAQKEPGEGTEQEGDRGVGTDVAQKEPGEGTEREGERGVGTDVAQKEPGEGTEQEGDRGVGTDVAQKEPGEGTEQEGDRGVGTDVAQKEPGEGTEQEGDRGVGTDVAQKEPGEGTEREGERGVGTDVAQKEPGEGTEQEGDRGVGTDVAQKEPGEGTEREGERGVGTDVAQKEPGEATDQEGDRGVGTDADRQETAQECKAITETRDLAVQTRHVIEGYEDLDLLNSISVRVENRNTATERAEAVRGLFDERTKALVTGFGVVEDFTAVDVGRALKVEGDETFELEPQKLIEGDNDYNRTAFVTVLRVPEAVADESSLRAASLETRRDGYAFTLAKVRATTQSCVSDGMIRPIKGDLASYPTYFLGKHYEPFKLLSEHKQAVILVCGGYGPHGHLKSGQLGPVLLRALHKHDSQMFQEDNPDIRATYLHKVGEGDARRYYLFGDSILTHFKDDTMAGVLQTGENSLCNRFPGLRIGKTRKGPNLCARNSPTSFTEDSKEKIHRALFHLVLPTTLAEQLACAPIRVDKPAETPANDTSTDTTSAKTASHRRLGCADKDELPDPHDLLTDLKERTYVFRAAIDVAYEFRRRTDEP